MNNSINLIVIFDNLRDRIILPLVGKRANLFAGHPTPYILPSNVPGPNLLVTPLEVGGPGDSRPRTTERLASSRKETTPSTGVQHTWGLATRGPG